MKRMNLFVGMIMFVFVFGMFIENVEAVTLSNDNEKTYTFISTNGEFCSATVRASLTQKYTENGAIRSYTDRSGYIGYTYVATYTIPKVTYSSDPKFVDSSQNTIKTFSPWAKQEVLVSKDTKVAYSKRNTTNVGYSNNNKYYLMQRYMVGNSDYMVTPWYGNSVKVKLGNS